MKTIRYPLRSALRRCTGLSFAFLATCSLHLFGQTIPNPSFESDTFTVWPGYISLNAPITGWTGTPEARVGLNPAAGSPFADNGTIPNGNNVAFIQANVDDPSSPSTLSTTLNGLTVGTTYKVAFRANARSANTPNVKVYIDGMGVLLPGGPDGLSTAAVGSANSYWTVAFDFQAAATSQILAVVNDATGDQTLLVDDFKIAPSSGKWSVEAWTGDADSGVDATFFYTHAYNFGSSASAVINGVTFTGVAGGAPAVAGQFSTAYLGILYAGDVNNLSGAGDGSAAMATDFVYGGNVPAGLYQTIAMQGLNPGTAYVVTIYTVAWEDASVGSRWATFSMGDDYLTANQDQFYDNNGIRISYRYTADASGTATLKFAPLVPQNVSFHVYGFSNREANSRDVAPVITVQPKNAVVSPDVPVAFSVAAGGVPAPTFQWRFKGAAIADATSPTYAIAAVSAALAGAYDVVVANRAGSMTSVVAQLTVGLPMVNPSFEADSFSVWPGYVSGNFPITGWNALGGHGLNPVADGRSPFADNGAIPNGLQVALLQGNGPMSQMVGGLTPGAQYYVHYFENSRNCCSGTSPFIEVTVGGSTIMPAHAVPPVLGGNVYHEVSSAVFVATAAEMELAFIKSNPQGGDTTALIDNVAIVPVPSGTAPAISSQPQPTTVYLGQPVSFGVMAQGTLPLRYQWWLNGKSVADATNATLSIAAVRLADEGDYTVVVSNDSGSVTSAVARLSLLEAIATLYNTGVNAAHVPLPAGAVDPFWTLLANPDSGSTSALVCNEGWPIVAGTWLVNSSTSKWIGPRATAGDASTAGGDYLYRTTFDLTGRDINTVTIIGRWASDNWGTPVMVNGATVDVPASLSFGSWTSFTITSSNATFLPGTNTIDFTVNNAGAGPTGLRVEFTKNSARTLPGVPPGIAVGPQGGEVAEGGAFTFAVSATGTLPLTYQWRKNGANLPGETNDTLTLVGLTMADSGDYSVKVSNQWGDALSANANLCVCWRPIPGIFGTGAAVDGTLLPEGAVDPHYTLTASADPNFPGPEALVITNVWPIQTGVWVVNGPNSKWIGPSSGQNTVEDPTLGNAEGDYTYRTTFDLTSYDVSKVKVAGAWAVDNLGTALLVNDVSSGMTSPGFASFTSFTITSGLVAGTNTLDFVVNNLPATPNPTGLRVDLAGYLNIQPVSRPTLTVSLSDGMITVSWSPASAAQQLESAPAVTGPWTPIAGAPNPYVTGATNRARFFRVVTP